MRISKRRQVFEKGYVAGWSVEIFIVTDRFLTTPLTYAIKDLAEEEIKKKVLRTRASVDRQEGQRA